MALNACCTAIILQFQNHWITSIMAFMQLLSNCYQKTFGNAGNPHKHWGSLTFQLFSSHQESPSCPPENRPSGTRKNQASFPFHSGNPTTFSSIFNFQFSDSMTSASVSASKPLLPPSLPSFHLSLINQAFFLFSRLFSGLKRELGRA